MLLLLLLLLLLLMMMMMVTTTMMMMRRTMTTTMTTMMVVMRTTTTSTTTTTMVMMMMKTTTKTTTTTTMMMVVVVVVMMMMMMMMINHPLEVQQGSFTHCMVSCPLPLHPDVQTVGSVAGGGQLHVRCLDRVPVPHVTEQSRQRPQLLQVLVRVSAHKKRGSTEESGVEGWGDGM